MKINTKHVSVGMPPAVYEELRKLAFQNGNNVPGYIRWLIWKHLDEENIPVSLFFPKEE